MFRTDDKNTYYEFIRGVLEYKVTFWRAQYKILESGSQPVLAYKPLQAIFLTTKGLLRRTGFADVKYRSRQRTYRVRTLSSIWWPEDTFW